MKKNSKTLPTNVNKDLVVAVEAEAAEVEIMLLEAEVEEVIVVKMMIVMTKAKATEAEDAVEEDADAVAEMATMESAEEVIAEVENTAIKDKTVVVDVVEDRESEAKELTANLLTILRMANLLSTLLKPVVMLRDIVESKTKNGTQWIAYQELAVEREMTGKVETVDMAGAMTNSQSKEKLEKVKAMKKTRQVEEVAEADVAIVAIVVTVVTVAIVATDVEVEVRKKKSHRLHQRKKRKLDSLMMITLHQRSQQI